MIDVSQMPENLLSLMESIDLPIAIEAENDISEVRDKIHLKMVINPLDNDRFGATCTYVLTNKCTTLMKI